MSRYFIYAFTRSTRIGFVHLDQTVQAMCDSSVPRRCRSGILLSDMSEPSRVWRGQRSMLRDSTNIPRNQFCGSLNYFLSESVFIMRTIANESADCQE